MSEEDLELLITLGDPGDGQEEDTCNHPQFENTLEYWPGRPFPAMGRLDQQAEAVIHNDAFTFTSKSSNFGSHSSSIY